MLHDSLQKTESKHGEITQSESYSPLAETLRAKEDENERLKAQMVDFTERQKDLGKNIIDLKI